jgi:Negative regulator of sigma E activity
MTVVRRMSRGRSWVSLIALVAILGAVPNAAWSADANGSKREIALLQKMQQAARSLDYAGVYTYQQGSTVLSTRVVHIVDGTGERERISLMDGSPREYIRHNETTQCLLPDHKVVLVEHRGSDRFPAILFDEGKRLPIHYELKLESNSQRVAGRSCQDLTLLPRDMHRYTFRLCADQETGLLLRAQTVGPEGVLTQVVFNMLEVGKGVNSEALSPSWNTKDWKVVELPVQQVDLASEGWRIPLPPGYETLTQVVRQMKAGRQVKQLVASDGLSSISVFIEAYSEADGQPRDLGLVRKGAMSVYRKRIGDHWLTVLGEVPADTVHDLAQRTEYVPLAVR